MKEVLDTEIDFDKLFEAKSVSEVAAILDKHLLGDNSEDSETVVAPGNKPSTVDEAFQELLAS